ncbi:MAG: hypothetical protein PHY54_18205 [Methylococcales bacterium]|nr:hypothetical protein [Methylococcales bacterium]
MQQIPNTATKCQFCGGFQNWRSHLDNTNTLISLLLAFFSVLALTIPVIIKAFTPDNSDVSVYYIDRSDVSIPVIVANDGYSGPRNPDNSLSYGLL